MIAIYNRLKSEIDSADKKLILLDQLLAAARNVNENMPVFLQSPDGRVAFCSAVSQLVADHCIAPVGAKPNTILGLHAKYRVCNPRGRTDDELTDEVVRSIVYPAKLDYYLKNPQAFAADREIISVICAYLRQLTTDVVTVNERAYELFGDEKFFRGAAKTRSKGETVLRRLGLSFADIHCTETPEPFFSFQTKNFHSRTSRTIFIIENKDTFWSFKRNVMDCASRVTADMVVYGEGKKIISSFAFATEYHVDPNKDEFLYFGDLDAEGINIYCELRNAYPEYRIIPFVEGYTIILEIGLRRNPVQLPHKQQIRPENITTFVEGFATDLGLTCKRFLEEGFYIPQEALSARIMRERFGGTLHDGQET